MTWILHYIFRKKHYRSVLIQEYKINIEENDEIGKEVFQVHAVDFDSPPFNKIHYKISNNDLLRVDSNTGKLFINRKIVSRMDNGYDNFIY